MELWKTNFLKRPFVGLEISNLILLIKYVINTIVEP